MTTIFFLLFLPVASTVFALTVNPVVNVVECQVSLLAWSGGVAPYNLINSADDPNAPALVDLGAETGTSCLWTATLAAGAVAILEVRDSAGNTAQSSSFTVQAGSQNNCLQSSDTSTSYSAGATSGATSPASGSVSATAGSNINASQNTSSTSTGDASGSSPSSAAATFHYTPVGALAMTVVAALAVALIL